MACLIPNGLDWRHKGKHNAHAREDAVEHNHAASLFFKSQKSGGHSALSGAGPIVGLP